MPKYLTQSKAMLPGHLEFVHQACSLPGEQGTCRLKAYGMETGYQEVGDPSHSDLKRTTTSDLLASDHRVPCYWAIHLELPITYVQRALATYRQNRGKSKGTPWPSGLEDSLYRFCYMTIPNIRQQAKVRRLGQLGPLRECILTRVASPDLNITGACLQPTKPSYTCSLHGRGWGWGFTGLMGQMERVKWDLPLLSCETSAQGLTAIVLWNQRTMETVGN